MDTKWPLNSWTPSACPLEGYKDPKELELVELTELRNALQTRTNEIKETPYNPTKWLARARVLMKLGFPELAAGDSYKARLLVDEFDESREPCMPLDQREKLACIIFKTNFDIFNMLTDNFRAISSVEAGKKRFPEDSFFQTATLPPQWRTDPNLTTSGEIIKRPYPWMGQEILWRDKDVITAARARIEAASNGYCTIRAIDPPMDECYCPKKLKWTEGSTDSFGIFALKDIEKGTVLFVEKTLVVSDSDMNERCTGCCKNLSDGRARVACCGSYFCRPECAAEAKKTYHRAVCRRMSSEYDKATDSPHIDAKELSDAQLLRRILAMAIQHPSPSPLQVPIINQLTAPHGGEYPMDFTTRIIIPNAILRDLGVDIFRDHDYDTWVIQIIMDRILNNQCGDFDDYGSWNSIYPLFTFFNHECHENVSWGHRSGNAPNRLTMTAKTYAPAGEELTINYNGNTHMMDFDKRTEGLKNWMPHGCNCEHCEIDAMIKIHDKQTLDCYQEDEEGGLGRSDESLDGQSNDGDLDDVEG